MDWPIVDTKPSNKTVDGSEPGSLSSHSGAGQAFVKTRAHVLLPQTHPCWYSVTDKIKPKSTHAHADIILQASRRGIRVI